MRMGQFIYFLVVTYKKRREQERERLALQPILLNLGGGYLFLFSFSPQEISCLSPSRFYSLF